MLIGVQLPEVEYELPASAMIELALTAEAAGFDSIWLGDHLLYDLPQGPRGPWEVWTMLAALAVATERVLIGPLVASTSFHSPAMLAKQAATVDALSEGRLILGLGAGWNRREYEAFGFPYDRRVSRFAEAFTAIRELLRNGAVDLDGEFYQLRDCILHPPAVRPGGPELMVGSIGPRMQEITLAHVDSWNVWWSDYGNTAAGFAAVKSIVDERIAALGRTGEVAATCAVHIQLPGGSGRVMGDYPGDESAGDTGSRPLRGSTEELAAHLHAFAAAGAEHVQLVLDPITADSIETMAHVLQHFRAHTSS